MKVAGRADEFSRTVRRKKSVCAVSTKLYLDYVIYNSWVEGRVSVWAKMPESTTSAFVSLPELWQSLVFV